MSAETADAAGDSWKIVLPCTRIEAEALASATDPFPDLDEPPVLNTLEPDESRPEEWLLEAYTEAEPDAATIAAVRALVPSAGRRAPTVEKVAAQDWVTLSQAGLEPIRAGRFYVHTAAHSDDVPAQTPGNTVAFRIEAGRAFGTGHHYTTTGCLEMLDRIKRQGARHRMIADVGTGTGLLAFAALALWPRAHALATDIDPVSIEVSYENAEANGVRLDRIGLAVAEGVDHPLYDALGPFDLVVANILAQPLIELAPSIVATMAPGGTLILAGLLTTQDAAVTAAYRREGMRSADTIVNGDWSILMLRKRRRMR